VTNTRKLKILFVAPYIPSRIRVRPYNFITGLAQRGHSVTFVGLAGSYANQKTIRTLTQYCDVIEIFRKSKGHSYFDCLVSLFGKIPLQSAYSFSRKMKKRIKDILLEERFDIIHIEHIRAGYMLPKVRHIPAVYDSVDCITFLYQSFAKESSSFGRKLITFIESKKLAKSEPIVLSKYETIIVTSSDDRYYLEKVAAKANYNIPKINVVENGVDYDSFQPQDTSFLPYSIVFTGKMGYYANELAATHFAEEILPLVKSQIPQVKFYIVGANPSKRIRRLKMNDNVIVTGWVPDIRRYLSLAHVVVCPMRVSVGIQNKLLEAMSMAKPVVTYPDAALLLKNTNNDVFLLAHNQKDFAEKIIDLMNNEALSKKLGTAARSYIQEFYSWDQKIKVLEDLYQKTIERYGNEYS